MNKTFFFLARPTMSSMMSFSIDFTLHIKPTWHFQENIREVHRCRTPLLPRKDYTFSNLVNHCLLNQQQKVITLKLILQRHVLSIWLCVHVRCSRAHWSDRVYVWTKTESKQRGHTQTLAWTHIARTHSAVHTAKGTIRSSLYLCCTSVRLYVRHVHLTPFTRFQWSERVPV